MFAVVRNSDLSILGTYNSWEIAKLVRDLSQRSNIETHIRYID